MIGWFAALQPLLVGAVLLWAGAFKLLARRAPALARRSALSTLVGKDRAAVAFRAVGSAELAVGAVLLAPPALAVEAVVATGLCIALLGYLGYARVVAPESSCGCLSAKHTPVRWRSFARTGVLAAASALAVAGAQWWLPAVDARPGPAVVVLAAEALVVLALSPDLDSYWLVPLRRLRVRLSHPLAGSAGFEIPVASSVQQLLRSPAFQAAGPWVRSDLLDFWDEAEWRVLSYTARYGGRLATAVFAVPRLRYEPDAVRAVLVDEADHSVLWEFAPAPAPVPTG